MLSAAKSLSEKGGLVLEHQPLFCCVAAVTEEQGSEQGPVSSG